VISMQLVERADGSGLVAAVEILRGTPRISKLIRDGAINELEEEIERSVSYHRMQTMNQSLAALVVNRVVTRKRALEVSPHPGDLDLMLRKLFYSAGATDAPGEEQDMDSDADFSRIHRLMEIERLYDELQEAHQQALSERDGRIAQLQRSLEELQRAQSESGARLKALQDERDRIARAMEALRGEYEAKIERLQARIRELSTEAPSRSGLFRR